MDRQTIRSGEQTLTVGNNEIFFKLEGVKDAFKNDKYTFLIFDALGELLNFDGIKYYADRVTFEYQNVNPAATLYIRYTAIPFT